MNECKLPGMEKLPPPTDCRLLTAARVVSGIVALGATSLGAWVIRNQLEGELNIIGGIIAAVLAVIALVCWWFTLRGHIAKSRERLRFTIMGGIIVGGIGFVAGFAGPMLLKPGANQGPLLGIFITGPIGFVVGAIAGLVYICWRQHRSSGNH